METDLRIGSLHVNHPFYSVARGEKAGMNELGLLFKQLFGAMHRRGVELAEQMPVMDALLKSSLWQRCHNWAEGRPALIAEEVNRLGLQVLCVQEVSDRYAQCPELAPGKEERKLDGSRTLIDIRDELNALEDENVWEALPFVPFTSSKDAEYAWACERGNGILVNTRHIQVTEQRGVYECDRSVEDKELVRRHPWADLVHKASGKLIRVASAHIAPYPRFSEELKSDEKRYEKAREQAELGNEELRGLLEELEAAPGAPALTLVGLDTNENTSKHELPEDLQRRAPCMDRSVKGLSILEQLGFFTNISGLKAKGSDAELENPRCVDVLAFKPSCKLKCHLPELSEDIELGSHKLTAIEFRF